MARIEQPRELAELKGADKKNPQRYKTEVPKSTQPLGEYPEQRSTDPKECWFELSALAIPGVLTGSDRMLMEVLSDLLAEYRTDSKAFPSAKMTSMISIAARFGMSSSDRNKLGISKADKSANPFAALDD